MDLKIPVSVVIPTFNAESTIVETLRSVAAQTFVPQEVIVVDDCSNDSSVEKALSVANLFSDTIFSLIRQPRNSGVAASRNVGWRAAMGSFIAFLDADDTWVPRKLELQYNFLKTSPDIHICGHRFYIKESFPNEYGTFEIFKVDIANKFKVVLSNPFVTPSVMVRRDIPFRFREGKRHMEDHLLWMEIALAGYKIAKLDAPLAILGKAQFGESGLSADLWAMELAELDNYQYLWREKKIGFSLFSFLYLYSLLKFSRRLLIVGFRRLRSAAKKALFFR
jgi:glycosyltransferase involved in cell wall biosynthesis